MILIADSGSTKTDWSLVKGRSSVKRLRTKGLNPYFQTKNEMEEYITLSLAHNIDCECVESVYFYGAVCNAANIMQVINGLINKFSKAIKIEAHSDVMAAARALCGHESGIACILGASSNSCLYDGKSVISNVSPLGYILGDEGSGAVLGKLFLSDLLKNRLSETLKSAFFEEMKLSAVTVMDRVYRQPFPNRFLTSLCPFILKHIEDESLYHLVYNSFYSFVMRNIAQYEGYKSLPINFVGSIAFHFKNVLINVLSDLNLNVGRIERSPVRGLIKYHTLKDSYSQKSSK